MGSGPRVLAGGKWPRLLLDELDARPGACWSWIAAHGQVVKDDRYSKTALLQLAGEPCFAKFYPPRSWRHGQALRSPLGRPLRSQAAAGDLLLADVRVPEPRGCLWLGDGALTLSQGLVDSEGLQLRWQSAVDSSERRQLLASTAESLARLHAAGYSHGDCKWSNLLCRGQQVYLVDLDAVRRTRVGGRRQARDLARLTLNAEELSVEAAEYELFLDRYFSALGAPRERLIARMLPQLRRLRDRHRRQYGEYGRALW